MGLGANFRSAMGAGNSNFNNFGLTSHSNNSGQAEQTSSLLSANEGDSFQFSTGNSVAMGVETAGSIAMGVETAGSIAMNAETAGTIAMGAETAGSVAFDFGGGFTSDGGSDFDLC